MTDCQTCNSKLVTDGLLPGQRFRCASCKTIFRFGKIEKVPTNKLAWRSFWLGISSIILMPITGIPAMYYGIRSLLRMRFVQTKPGDRAAAVIGTALGGCFGLFFGFLAMMVLGIGLASYMTYNTYDSPDEVTQRCDEIFEFEVPSGFKPVKAETALGLQKSFDFADKNDESQRTARLHLRYLGSAMQTNEARLIESLASKSVKGEFGAVRSSELKRWTMIGEETDVRKTVFEASETNENIRETHHYFALMRVSTQGYYGMAIVFEPENFLLSEEDVKEIFASLSIVEFATDIQPMDEETPVVK